METRILGSSSYPFLEVALQPGDKMIAESGAMAWMDSHVSCKTEARGGILSGMKRKLLAGESFFQNTFSVEREPGTIAFVSGNPGSIIQYEMDRQDLFLEKGAYLASTPGVEIDAKFEGLKGLFNEGFFVMRATGQGTMFFTGYGDVQEVQVNGRYIVDNGYAVAWEPTLQYRLTRARKIRSFLFSDQLLLEFTGQGRIWVQSRSAQTLANFFHPFRPVEKKDND